MACEFPTHKQRTPAFSRGPISDGTQTTPPATGKGTTDVKSSSCEPLPIADRDSRAGTRLERISCPGTTAGSAKAGRLDRHVEPLCRRHGTWFGGGREDGGGGFPGGPSSDEEADRS